MAIAVPLALSSPGAAAEPRSATPRAASSWVWDDTVALSPLGQSATDHQVDLSGDGQIQTAAWSQSGATYVLYTRTSRDGGSTWDDSIAHSRPGRAHTEASLAVSTSGQVQGMVWSDGFGPDKTIRFTRSSNSGVTWDDSVALSPLTSFAESPRLAMSSDGSVMSTIWSRFASHWRVETRRTVDSGANWDDSKLLNGTGTVGVTPWIDVSTAGNRQAALWSNLSAALARESANAGATWDDSVAVGPNGGTVYSPRIATSSNGLIQLAIWRRLVSGYYLIQGAVSSDGGSTWSSVISFSAAGGEAGTPTLAISSDGLTQTVAWERLNGTFKIVQSRTSSDGGATWSAVQEHSPDGVNSQNPDVAMSSDGARQSIAFSTNTGALSDLIVRTSDTSGSTWDDTVTVARNARNNADPRLAMSQDGTRQTVVFRAVVGASTIIQSATAYSPPPAPPSGPPQPPLPATAPRSPSAEPGDASVLVRWEAPVSSGSYAISTYQAIASPGGRMCLTSGLSCTVDGLTNGTTYTFTVKALTGAGWSTASEPSNAVTPSRREQTSILIAGVREGSRLVVTGRATGTEPPEMVTPFVARSTGDFEAGAAVVVGVDGSLAWSRRASRAVVWRVYMASGEVRSNTITIR